MVIIAQIQIINIVKSVSKVISAIQASGEIRIEKAVEKVIISHIKRKRNVYNALKDTAA